MKKLLTFFLALIISAGTMFATECFLNDDFRTGQGSWTIDNKLLNGVTSVWSQTSNYGMKATAYADEAYHETESWLISPAIELNSGSNATLIFSHARKYGDLSQLSVRVKTVDDDTWTTVQVSSWPDGSNWNFKTASVDLSPFVFHTIQIAFVYTSTTSAAATWEIKSVSISDGVYKGIFYYTLDDFYDATLISNPCGEMYYGDVYIPDSINYNGETYRVTNIGDCAFHLCAALTSVTIGNSVMSIGAGAFSYCPYLTSVELPSSIRSIGSKAFNMCKRLTSVMFTAISPDVMEISSNAFDGCSQLTSIYVPFGCISNYKNSEFFPEELKPLLREAIPEVAAPADGYVTVVIEIPEGSECNGIAFKGTLDGTNWSAPNTYVGDTMASASVAQCIQFSIIDDAQTWYKATYKLGTIGLKGKVCLIFSNDDQWQGQAHDYSIIDAKTTANASIDNDRNIVITNTGVVYVKIQSWADSECEDPTSRTVVLIAPPYICGGDAPTIAGQFNGWNPTTFPMTQIVNEYNMFCAKMAAKNIQYYKFAGLVNGWNNQIQIYDQEHSTWNDNPDLRFGNQAVIVVDYSAAYNHRWSKAQELPCTSLNQVQPYSGSSVNITSADLSKGKVLIYDASTTLILIAVPEPDMQFVAWSDGNTDNPRAITWEQDLTLTASFVESGTNPATEIEDIRLLDPPPATKLLQNGQLLILRGDKTYTLTGQEVQ